jgi:hypothetical protein
MSIAEHEDNSATRTGFWRRLLRFQFSLRGLLLLLTVIAVGCWYFTSSYRNKARAIARLEELGASICYDFNWPRPGVWNGSTDAPGKPWLKGVLGEHYAAEPVEVQLFIHSNMRPEEFSDEDAILVSRVPTIEWLALFDTKLTDEGLMYLGAIRDLGRLDVEGTLVTKAGVKKFRQLRPDVDLYVDLELEDE